MKKFITALLLVCSLFTVTYTNAQSDSIVLRDLTWDKQSPAGSTELFIPSNNSLLAGVIYRANGAGKHPTLFLLHGYPGNERNLDIAQVVRARGWNVIYFNYRGAWGSQGKFSFSNCVEDVVNAVKFCNKYQDSLKIDTSNMVLFGHSMGGWVCLQALAQLPQIKKGFALSTWDIYGNFKEVKGEAQLAALVNNPNFSGKYFVLNTPPLEIFSAVIKEPAYFNLAPLALKLASKQIIMVDEHPMNKPLADAFKNSNRSFFDYQVWQTDHSFTNKRISLINKVITFLDK
jgi:pimeloyl-ACP methyl ester carboxylesterase